MRFKVGESSVTPPLPVEKKMKRTTCRTFVKFTKCGAAWDILNVFNKAISTTAKKATSRKKVKSLKPVKKTDSSQEETEHLDPCSRIQDEVDKRHEAQFQALINEYEENGDPNNVARVKLSLKRSPSVYRKELRKVLFEYLQWRRAMKKDTTFRKIMETQKDLKDTEGFDWLESTELAIDKRKFLLNRLFAKQAVIGDED